MVMFKKSLAVILVLAFVSNFIGFFNQRVYADVTNPRQSSSVGIDGTVRGDPPKNPATISTPGNGQTFAVQPIKVSGLCTTGLLVKIFKNGVFAGSAQCISGSYSLIIDLFDGKNDLIARVYDALDQAGPDDFYRSAPRHDRGNSSSGAQGTAFQHNRWNRIHCPFWRRRFERSRHGVGGQPAA